MRPLPVRQLEPLDYGDEIEALGPLRPPVNTTDFLEEVGSKFSRYSGTDEWNKNETIEDIIRPLIPLLEEYNQWKATSTLIQDVWRTVKEKVDKAPQENHGHFKRLWSAYKAIATYILEQRPEGLTIKSYSSLVKLRRPYSKVGWREPDVRKFRTMSRYLKRMDAWKPKVELFKRCLIKNRPILCTFSTVAKRETKDKRSSRLIWCLPATARIYENRIVGNLDELVKVLHYFIQGTPVVDYGERLNEIFTEDKHAVCDDISGWDTKLSLGILSLESAFVQRLALKKGHRKQVRKLYRLYSHPLVKIARPAGRHYISSKNSSLKKIIRTIEEDQDAFFQLRGQRASGSRVTYAMNTITNIAVTMSRAAYSQGVSQRHMYRFALQNLRKGHTRQYGGFISGDDSVIILGKQEAKNYATLGAEFMEDLGMPRKGFKPYESSKVCTKLEEVEFCSRSFVRTTFRNGFQRWMPVRSIGQILAKSVIMLDECGGKDEDLAYARFHGFNLLLDFAHLPTIRLVALALLSVTPNNLLYRPDGSFCYRTKPWVTKEYFLSKLNRKLKFGENTPYWIRNLSDLGNIEDKYLLEKYDLEKSERLEKWKKTLYKRVQLMRQRQKGKYDFDDWIKPEKLVRPAGSTTYDSLLRSFRIMSILPQAQMEDVRPIAQLDYGFIQTPEVQSGRLTRVAPNLIAELPYYSAPEDNGPSLEEVIDRYYDTFESML